MKEVKRIRIYKYTENVYIVIINAFQTLVVKEFEYKCVSSKLRFVWHPWRVL